MTYKHVQTLISSTLHQSPHLATHNVMAPIVQTLPVFSLVVKYAMSIQTATGRTQNTSAEDVQCYVRTTRAIETFSDKRKVKTDDRVTDSREY